VELKYYPDPVLRRRTRPVREVDGALVDRVHQMLELMYESEGIGLAAPQVGWSVQAVTLDVELAREGERVFLNPRIVDEEGTEEVEEGCLSLPHVQLTVPRAARVKIVAYTLAGERVEIEAEGLLARAWQHEIDHLNGLLITDKVQPAALMAVRGELKRLEQDAKAARRGQRRPAARG